MSEGIPPLELPSDPLQSGDLALQLLDLSPKNPSQGLLLLHVGTKGLIHRFSEAKRWFDRVVVIRQPFLVTLASLDEIPRRLRNRTAAISSL